MKVISLNVGKPKPYEYKGKLGYTSFFKTPVVDERKVSTLNIDGDEQADLTVHGGKLKAVYSYDISYYEQWKQILQREEWGYGLFGENLTTQNLPDDEIFVGNIYQIGSVYLKAIQPRFPCFKLSVRFESEFVLKNFVKVGKHGTYFSVQQQGSLRAGDDIHLIEASKHRVTIQQIAEAYYNNGSDKNLLNQILTVDCLPDDLQQTFIGYL